MLFNLGGIILELQSELLICLSSENVVFKPPLMSLLPVGFLIIPFLGSNVYLNSFWSKIFLTLVLVWEASDFSADDSF